MIDCGHYVDEPVPSGEGVVVVGAGERLDDVFILRPGSSALPYDRIVAMEGSEVKVCVIVMPGTDAGVPLRVDLAGENASVKLGGAYLCGGGESVSFRTELRHRVGHCVSEQLFNGIAGGNSRAEFHGRIVVAPDAQKTEAYQTNHNIVVSDTARVDTKPQLEIYADDVKCTHGSTVGSLNADEQFYMRSRGIPEKEARILQMISFITPVLDMISDSGKREEIAAEIERNVRAI